MINWIKQLQRSQTKIIVRRKDLKVRISNVLPCSAYENEFNIEFRTYLCIFELLTSFNWLMFH